MKKLIRSLPFLGLSLGLFGQANVTIHQIDLRQTRKVVCEPSIAINLKNPANLVAGSVYDDVYFSTDSGRTWQAQTLTSSYGVYGDPVLWSDTAGALFYAHLSDVEARGWESDSLLDRIVIQKSLDGGKTWSNGTYTGLNFPKAQDKHWSVVDLTNNNIYLTWTQFDEYGSADTSKHSNILFSRSIDGGETWSDALTINSISGDCRDGDSTVEGAVPAVGPNGEIYVTWAYDQAIYFNRSLDYGRTWLPHEQKVAEQAGGWVIEVPGLNRANGLPVLVADQSQGEQRGNLYLNWVDKRNGNYDVWMMRSEDGGEQWSEPIRINQDTTEADQFFSWLAVDQANGDLYAVYYDRRHSQGVSTHVYLARSTDGGDSWEEMRISEEAFSPIPQIFFGDYNHIVAWQGMVRPIWTFLDGPIMGLKTALLKFKD